MRISVKGRYALAAMISMAENYSAGECTTVSSIAERLGISKIYLEQVFALLKRGEVVKSIKGSQGGYQLMRLPSETTVLQILSAVEHALFEPADQTVADRAPALDQTIQSSVFDPLDRSLRTLLASITLADLVKDLENRQIDQAPMFYI